MVQMNVRRRDDQLRVIMLQIYQMIAKLWPVVIVDQGERPCYILRTGFPRSSRKKLSDQLPHRFAPRGKLLLLAIPIELRQQVPFERYRETHDVRHGLTSDPQFGPVLGSF